LPRNECQTQHLHNDATGDLFEVTPEPSSVQ